MISEQVVGDIDELQLQQTQIPPLWRIRHLRTNWIIYSKKIRKADIENICRIAESLSLAQIDPYIWGEFTKQGLFENNIHPPYQKIGLLGVTEESSAPTENVREFLVEGFGREYTLDVTLPSYDKFEVSDRFLLLPKHTKLLGNPTLIDFSLISEESFIKQHKSGLIEIVYFD